MDLDPDTTNGKYEASITKFSHYTSITIYTLHRDKGFGALPVKVNCYFHSQ
jgi:hypothetical protein